MRTVVIHVDRSKFSEEDWELLEMYRQVAIMLKKVIAYDMYEQTKAKGKREWNKIQKEIDAFDLLRCHLDSEMFDMFPVLPDEAIHIFY